jgi:hypothetical protein
MHVTRTPRTRPFGRRSLLKAAGGAAAGTGATAVGAGAGTAAATGGHAHPGLLHTRADLDRMAATVQAGAAPYVTGYAKLTANRHARSIWTANPQATVYRGSGSPQNYPTLHNDVHAAYQNVLRYHVGGDTAHADTAVAVLNAWSATLTSLRLTVPRGEGGSAPRTPAGLRPSTPRGAAAAAVPCLRALPHHRRPAP